LSAADPWIEAAGRRFVMAHVVGTALHAYPAAFYLDKVSRWLASMRRHLALQGLWGLATGGFLWALARARTARGRGLWIAALGLLLFGELSANLSDYNATLPRASLAQVPASVTLIRQDAGAQAPAFRSLMWGLGAQLRRSFPRGRFYGDLDGELRNNALIPPALNKLYGLNLVNAYPSPDFTRLQPFTGWFLDLNMDPPQRATELLGHRRLFDVGGARYLVLGEPLSAPGLTPLMSDPVYVYRNERALPLAYVADHYSDAWTPQTAVAALCGTGQEARWPRPALVEGHAAGSGRGGGSVQWLDNSDTQWSLRVSSRGPGVLVLSRFFYPGPWKATVDGKPEALWAANGALCALALKSGTQSVRVFYDDPLPARALAAEIAGLLLAALGLVLGLAQAKDGAVKAH
jgi:hypothetical protein